MTPQMMAMIAKTLGIDFNAVIGQAQSIGDSFTAMKETLARIEANQQIIMTHMGIISPVLTPEQETIIASGVRLLTGEAA